MGSCAWEKKYPPPDLTPAARAAWELYNRSQSQWNVGMSGATGMRYDGVEACARMAGIESNGRVFELFQLLEGRRLQIWGEERAAQEAEAKRKRK